MAWEIEFIQWLQKSGGKFLDTLMFLITQIGGELFFIGVAAIIFWCINKKQGYKFINIFILGLIAVNGIKSVVKRPRPYTLQSINPIKETTSGYSFPSGHSHNAASMSTQLTLMTKSKEKKVFLWSVIIGSILTVLVMFSRVYLGQHYPSDVIVGCVLGITIAIIGSYLFDLLGDKEEVIAYVVAPLCIIISLVCLLTLKEKAEEIVKVCGAYSALTIGYFVEKRHIKYKISQPSFIKIACKILIGILVLLIIKEGLKFLFTAIMDENSISFLIFNEFVRYFLIGIWTIICCPLIFKKLKI